MYLSMCTSVCTWVHECGGTGGYVSIFGGMLGTRVLYVSMNVSRVCVTYLKSHRIHMVSVSTSVFVSVCLRNHIRVYIWCVTRV